MDRDLKATGLLFVKTCMMQPKPDKSTCSTFAMIGLVFGSKIGSIM